MQQPEYDPRYLQGIQYFNECEFFEAHEVWEDLWADTEGPPRKFFQGLIQAAVCLHHFGNGNIRGARKLYHSCRTRYLDAYRPFHLGINLERFLSELQACCQPILDSDDEYPQIEIDADSIPEIHLEAPPP